MNNLEEKYGWLSAPQVIQHSTPSLHTSFDTASAFQGYVTLKNEQDKMLVFERAGLLFIFNFHPVNSYTDYRVGIEEAGEYHVVLTSDHKRFGGFDNIQMDSKYFTTPMEWNGRKNWLQVFGSVSCYACKVAKKM
jgi:1,4-alpha-glucan branching enzyme